ncbi:MAG: hypothetical protein FD167_96 [bacterium]|nr:MAG: hypothetical protein FD167_96 [bacterium]
MDKGISMNRRRTLNGGDFLLGLLTILLILGGNLSTIAYASCPSLINNGWPANGFNGTITNPTDIVYGFTLQTPSTEQN